MLPDVAHWLNHRHPTNSEFRSRLKWDFAACNPGLLAMQLFCPDCQTAFTGVSRCPRCSGLLLMPDETPPDPGHRSSSARPTPIRPTPVGRVVVGTIVALGLYLGLRKLLIGWVFATEPDPAGWWLSTESLTAVFALQAIAGLFGAVLAGAGRESGFSLGAATAGCCGGLFLAAEMVGGVPSGHLVMYLQPFLLAFGGGIAGSIGARVWAAVPELDMPRPVRKKQSSIQLDTDRPESRRRPTSWVRVLVGATVIMAGVGLADPIRVKTEFVTGGALKAHSFGQSRFISWQIATLAVLGGGMLAGSATGAGTRHGVIAGLLGAVGVIALSVSQGGLSPPMAYVVDKLEIAASDINHPVAVAVAALTVLMTGLVGGWLGGTLLLPLAPPHMRKGRLRLGGD